MSALITHQMCSDHHHSHSNRQTHSASSDVNDVIALLKRKEENCLIFTVWVKSKSTFE